MHMLRVATLIGATLVSAATVKADILVGVVTAMTGPNASLGVPYKKGLELLPQQIGGERVVVTVLDDASDPSTAVRNAQKLVTDGKVDIIIGPGNTPAGQAVVPIAAGAKTPHIALTPLALSPAESEWTIAIPQPGEIWILPILKDMVKRGVKKVAFIGFNDPWGDLTLAALKGVVGPANIEIVAEERYARTDNSVTGQILRIISKRPDAIFVGGSGTPGVLPHIALAERRWTGPAYGTPAVFNQDFLRLGGPAVEGVMAVTGPIGAYEQLPDSNPTKAVSAAFVKAFEAINGPGSSNGFSAYAHDAVRVFEVAAAKALKVARPGTPEFRKALRDSIRDGSETVGAQGVYSFKDGHHYGVDDRSVVLVKVEKNAWKLVP